MSEIPAASIMICMGSSCFSRGNSRNIEVIQNYLGTHSLPPGVELELRERPDVSRDQTNPGKVLVPVYAGSATKPVSYGKKRQKAVRISKK